MIAAEITLTSYHGPLRLRLPDRPGPVDTSDLSELFHRFASINRMLINDVGEVFDLGSQHVYRLTKIEHGGPSPDFYRYCFERVE